MPTSAYKSVRKPPRIVKMQASGGQWTAYALGIRNRAAYCYAHEFHHVSLKAGSPLVRAFLLAQALELYLKSYLLAAGLGTKELSKRPYGHNLARLLAECESRGLATSVPVSDEARADVAALSNVYASKALQYFSLLHLLDPPQLPPLDRIGRLARALDKFVASKVGATP